MAEAKILRYFEVSVIHEGGVVSQEKNLIIAPNKEILMVALKGFKNGGLGVGNELENRRDACPPDFRHTYEIHLAIPVFVVDENGKIHT